MYTYIIHTCTYIYIHILTMCRMKLTDEGVCTHFLANDCRIAAEKYRNWGYIGPSIPLCNFVHGPSVDCAVLALVACSVYLFKLCILPSPKPWAAKQFLNSVVHGPEKEDHALTPISRLRKVLMHDASWNVEPDSFFPHGFHLSVADSVRPELWICCPLQHPVSMCISTVRC
jgi:hypothetical protein